MSAPMTRLAAIFALIFCVSSGHNDEFNEELYIKPLPSGHIHAHFQFTTILHADLEEEKPFQHYHLFPKQLGEVIKKYNVQELHLSLSQGRWRHESWGYPINDAPPGAELWVWFMEGTTQIDKTWTDLINVLSGMFCASLNQMDAKSTVKPKYSFRPQGVTTSRFDMFAKHLLRYAALPKENVCTENLSPWKKMLPCSGMAGLGSLIRGIKLFDTNFVSQGVHFRPICRDSTCKKRSVELSQTLSVVFDPYTMSAAKQDWSLKKLFGRGITDACPLSTNSLIYVDSSANKTQEYFFALSPEPTQIVTRKGGRYAVYHIELHLATKGSLNLAAKYNQGFTYQQVAPPVVHAHRFQTGFGQEKGGITSLLFNNHPTKEINVIYMETVPWYLRMYLHTLTIRNYHNMGIGENGTRLRPLKTHYVPGKDRERSYHLELVMALPPSSVTKVSFQFDRALLKWTEYPPDANHGFYVNAAVLGAVVDGLPDIAGGLARTDSSINHRLLDESDSSFLQLHTETLLISLPTPDFSMPYNVICLACTVVAIAFGSIHNLTTRRFIIQDPTKPKGLIAKVRAFFSRIRNKKAADKSSGKEAGKGKEGKVTESGDTSGVGDRSSSESKKDQ